MLNLWTVPDIAKQAGTSQTYIRDLIYKGKLPAEKVGRAWVIPGGEGQKWLELRAKKKPPTRRIIIDPDLPDLTIGEVIDDVQDEEAQVMARQPNEWMMINGYFTNLWQMDDGWWLFDMPAIEGNRAQAETKEDAIQSAMRGIKSMRDLDET